jgi:hypothetical protein
MSLLIQVASVQVASVQVATIYRASRPSVHVAVKVASVVQVTQVARVALAPKPTFAALVRGLRPSVRTLPSTPRGVVMPVETGDRLYLAAQKRAAFIAKVDALRAVHQANMMDQRRAVALLYARSSLTRVQAQSLVSVWV